MPTLDYRRPDHDDAGRRHLVPACIILLLATPPQFAWLWLLATWTHARTVVGHWPSYGQPDPKTIAPPPFFIDFFLPFIATLILWIVSILLLRRFVPARNWLGISLVILPCCWLGGCCCAYVDPMGIINWIVD